MEVTGGDHDDDLLGHLSQDYLNFYPCFLTLYFETWEWMTLDLSVANAGHDDEKS